MKYKYSRKEFLKKVGFLFSKGKILVPNEVDGEELMKLLLAQKEDKKEINYCQVGKPQKPVKCTVTCTGGEFKFYKTLPPTPSPLEIEEIEEMSLPYSDAEITINKLIRNQKKLYQFIKEKL